MQAVLRANGLSPTDTPTWPALLERLRREAVERGTDPRRADGEVSMLKTLGDNVLGLRLNDPTRLDTALRVARKWNTVRLMGLAVWSHINNLGAVVGDTGFADMLKTCPAILDLFRKGADGKLDSNLAQEIIAATALGTEGARTQLLGRMDADASLREFTAGTAQRILDRGGTLQAHLGLLAPVTAFIQRLSAVAAQVKWMGIAKSGKLPSPKRLASVGLTPADGEAVIAQIKAHATLEGPQWATNLEEWDPGVRAKYVAAIDKWSRRVAQQNNIGSMSQWMTTELGRAAIQFRAYHIAAYEKQLLFGLQNPDLTTFRNWALLTLLGGLSYMAREHLASIGRPDREEYLARRLTPLEIGKAAFARSGYLSMFPMVVDGVGKYTGIYSPVFTGTRSSGLESDPIFGNPTWDLALQATRLPKALIDGVRRDRNFSQEDLRTLRAFIPFQNMLGVKNVLDAIQSGRPARSEMPAY
jgi:hypothetical protein